MAPTAQPTAPDSTSLAAVGDHRLSRLLTGPLPAGLSTDELGQVMVARFLAAYSGHTRAAYRRDLTHFMAWCEEHDLVVLDAGRSTIDAYARSLTEQLGGDDVQPRGPLKPTTIARRLATLAGYFTYAVSEGVIDRSPVIHVRRPRVAQDSTALGLDRAEAQILVRTARMHNPRALALVTLLLHDGLRISEALGADAADLETSRGHRVLRILRKGGSRRIVALNPATADAIDTYLDGRAAGPLFATRSGGRYDRSEAWRLIRRLAADAGLQGAARLSPHSLRHTFVTLAREAGVPLEDVQDAAGHADPRTTRRYDRGRHNLDRSPSYALGVYLSTGQDDTAD